MVTVELDLQLFMTSPDFERFCGSSDGPGGFYFDDGRLRLEFTDAGGLDGFDQFSIAIVTGVVGDEPAVLSEIEEVPGGTHAGDPIGEILEEPLAPLDEPNQD